MKGNKTVERFLGKDQKKDQKRTRKEPGKGQERARKGPRKDQERTRKKQKRTRKGPEKDQLKTKVCKLLRKHPVFTCISFPLIKSAVQCTVAGWA
jgi:hypothetical protein